MDKIVVKKSDLLAKLKANRATHAQDHEDSLAGYKAETLKLLKKAARLVKAGKPVNFHIDLSQPRNFLVEYDRAIGMLEMDTQDTVSLSAVEFDRFVNDEWGWKQEFDMTTSNYAGKIGKGR